MTRHLQHFLGQQQRPAMRMLCLVLPCWLQPRKPPRPVLGDNAYRGIAKALLQLLRQLQIASAEHDFGAKIVEEAIEVVEAGDEPGEAGGEHLVKEVADLVFHTAVLLGYRELSWGAVEAELARRFGISGITEKEARG